MLVSYLSMKEEPFHTEEERNFDSFLLALIKTGSILPVGGLAYLICSRTHLSLR
jgi:hypothetical protein